MNMDLEKSREAEGLEYDRGCIYPAGYYDDAGGDMLREEITGQVQIGGKIHSVIFGDGVLKKINKKTFTVQFGSWLGTIDKILCEALK